MFSEWGPQYSDPTLIKFPRAASRTRSPLLCACAGTQRVRWNTASSLSGCSAEGPGIDTCTALHVHCISLANVVLWHSRLQRPPPLGNPLADLGLWDAASEPVHLNPRPRVCMFCGPHVLTLSLTPRLPCTKQLVRPTAAFRTAAFRTAGFS